MKKLLLFSSVIALSVALAACGSQPPQPTSPAPTAGSTAAATAPAITPSATPDLCTQEQLPESVKIVNTYMREFSNFTSLSYQVPSGALPQLIVSMQGINQALQHQTIPPCLIDLKHYALQYMTTVIQTESTFASQPTPDPVAFEAGREQALEYYNQYATELARLLGVTLAPPNETPVVEATPTQGITTVMNPGPNPLNLHVAPSLPSESIGLLEANQSAKALGKSSNGEWIQIDVPGHEGTKAWVYASLVQYTSGDASVLPVATP